MTTDIVALSGNPEEPEITLPENVRRIHRLPATLQGAVSQVRALAPDILLFGVNTTAVVSLPTLLGSLRLAPLQLTNFVSPSTTGLWGMDLFVSGTLLETTEAEVHHTERLVRLEGPGFCFALDLDPVEPGRIPTREALGVPPDALLIVSGANFHKAGPETRRAWARILAALPEAVLLLWPFGPNWQMDYPEAAFEEAMRRALAEEGVAPDRLRIARTMPDRESVLGLVAAADFYVDAFPHSGATSLFDPLQFGIPVLTVAGRTLRARQGAAILRDFGLDELVMPDPDAYVREAVALARDGARRQRLRERILEAWQRRPRCLDPADHARQWQELLLEETARLAHDPARRAFSEIAGAVPSRSAHVPARPTQSA